MCGITRSPSRQARPRWAWFALPILAVCAVAFAAGDTNTAFAQARTRADQTLIPSGRVRTPAATPLSVTRPPTATLARDTKQVSAWWTQIGSLKDVKPVLPDTSAFIADEFAARQLGKALVWDTQAGQDGDVNVAFFNNEWTLEISLAQADLFLAHEIRDRSGNLQTSR